METKVLYLKKGGEMQLRMEKCRKTTLEAKNKLQKIREKTDKYEKFRENRYKQKKTVDYSVTFEKIMETPGKYEKMAGKTVQFLKNYGKSC